MRRGHTAGVARFKGRYYDAGRQVVRLPAFHPAVFDGLIEAELLARAAPDCWRSPRWTRTGPALHRLALTGDGTPDSSCAFRGPAPEVE